MSGGNDNCVIDNLHNKNNGNDMRPDCLIQSDPNSSLSFCVDLKSNIIKSFPLD